MANKQKRKEKKELNRNLYYEHVANELDRGRIMRENSNGDKYSPEYTQTISKVVVDKIIKKYEECVFEDDPRAREFLHYFFTLKDFIRDLLIYWSNSVEKGYQYRFLKKLMEIYWDLKKQDDLIYYITYIEEYAEKTD